MNNKGLYARVSRSQGHTGTKYHLYWGDLDDAELFHNSIHKHDYGNITDELKNGIFISATVTRIVTLIKDSGIIHIRTSLLMIQTQESFLLQLTRLENQFHLM